ncbi:MAG: DUF2939 domain-containing protein [Phenylobacterium sp.]
MRRFWLVITIIVAAAALAFLSAPWFALRALQADARDGDVQGLAELIDYPAVRAGLRSQTGPEPAAAPPSFLADPMGAVRRALEPLQAPAPSVERHLAPAGLAALAGPPQVFPRIVHWGPNRVRYATRAKAQLTFQRRGLVRWKLVHIGLPPAI